MTLVVHNVDSLVSLANKVASEVFPVITSYYVEILVIAMTVEDADIMCCRLRPRIDSRFTLVSTSFDKMRRTNLSDLRYRTRGFVIMCERLSLGTQIVGALEDSLRSAALACCVGDIEEFKPIPRDLIVDVDAKTFYRK